MTTERARWLSMPMRASTRLDQAAVRLSRAWNARSDSHAALFVALLPSALPNGSDH